MATRKDFKPAKYSQEKISDPQITHKKKFLNYEISTRKNFNITKCRQEQISDAQNTLKK